MDKDTIHAYALSNLAHVDWIVVTLAVGVLVNVVWALPCLWQATVVPDVAVVGEAVVHEASLALLLVLDDGVEWQILADLHITKRDIWSCTRR
jgi:hypothetical protein